MAMAGLEARYRRLLSWFPADHRVVHGEEMLGVLMAASDGDRKRPGLADSADLLLGAARLRLRPRRALSDGAGWRDALAIFSIAGPVLILTAAVLSWLACDLWLEATGQGAFVDIGNIQPVLQFGHPILGTMIWLAISGLAPVIVLGLLGLRRLAALAAFATAVYIAAVNATETWRYPIQVAKVPFLVIPALATAAALFFSAGPRRGLALIRPRHWAMVAVGGVAGAILSENFYVFIAGEPGYEAILLLAWAAVVALLAGLWLASGLGKRLAVLFALLAYQAGLALFTLFAGPFSDARPLVLGNTGDGVVFCAVAALLYVTRRRSRSGGRLKG